MTQKSLDYDLMSAQISVGGVPQVKCNILFYVAVYKRNGFKIQEKLCSMKWGETASHHITPTGKQKV